MKKQYLESMLSLALAHMVLALTFMSVTGEFHKLAIAIPVNLIWLVGMNLLGSYLIFRPISRYLDCQDNRIAALKRVHHLRWLSVTWGVLLVLPLTVFALFVVRPFCPDCNRSELIFSQSPLVAIFTIFCATYLYFLIDDFVSRLKNHLFEHFDIVFQPAGGKLMVKLLFAFVSIGVLPMSLTFMDIFIPENLRTSTVIQPQQVTSFYLLISIFMSITTFFLIQRSLRRPVKVLLHTIKQVQAGNFEQKSPVITDDEFGVLAHGFNQMVDGLKDQKRLRETFGNYVPEEIARIILKNDGVIEPQRQFTTILYTDIEGFTTICESLLPENVVTMLNEYFSALVEIIRRHGGVVTQFQGDAILSIFNIPIENPTHATDAIQAALEIQNVVTSRTFGDSIVLPTRIGINTGHVIAGPVGEGHRLSYTVHGSAVNLAARLEQLNKQLGTRVLVSRQTRDIAGEGFAFKPLGEFPIRGIAEPVTIFEATDLHPK